MVVRSNTLLPVHLAQQFVTVLHHAWSVAAVPALDQLAGRSAKCVHFLCILVTGDVQFAVIY